MIYCMQKNFFLRKRAIFFSKIRSFFFKKKVLEIDTPLLTKYTITDVNISSLKVVYQDQFLYNKNIFMWLITSPEYHMKRLLSLGIGPIYQICHVFRKDEIGRYHNPEFTMLEWYQPFYDMFDMIDMIKFFFYCVFNILYCEMISYQDIFIRYLNIDPLHTNKKELNSILCSLHHKHLISSKNNIVDILELLFMIYIQPKIGLEIPIFIYHYPREQAMLARINQKNHLVSDRFEIFFKGIEIGNGFYELINKVEQKKRFEQDNVKRVKYGLESREIDFRLLNALDSQYMPDCSGVAIGIDRLMMILLGTNHIKHVISFSFENC
ncbi:Elongation factor P--(R)-beta-lysine ligase [Buchnera aphidicola (Pterocallis alni)]